MPPHHPEPAPKQYEPFNVTNQPQPEPSAPSTLSKLSALQMPLRPFLATLVILLAISLGVGYVVVFRTDLVNAWAGLEETPSWPPAPVTTPRTTAVASDPTANWQTYQNEEYGFEFKYPENLMVTDFGRYEDKSFYVALDTRILGGSDGYLAPLNFRGNDISNSDIDRLRNQGGYSDIKTTTRAGYQATLITYPPEDPNGECRQSEIRDCRLVPVTYSYINLGSRANESVTVLIRSDYWDNPMVDQILSTFRFTN